MIDRVGLAGGNTKFGSPKRIEAIQADGSKDEGLYIDISRGDVIIVPKSLSPSLMGDLSTLRDYLVSWFNTATYRCTK